MSVLVCTLQGRFGNQCLQYLFCRALAERYDMELRVDPWIGERVFDIASVRPVEADERVERFNELTIEAVIQTIPKEDWSKVAFRGYAQCKSAMIYTKRDAQGWLKLRPEILAACANKLPPHIPLIAHQRVGDYAGYGYPIVSRRSYYAACERYGLDVGKLWILFEERDEQHPELPADLSFVPDFYRMMHARTLLRGNSTFSWLAALLGNGLVLSPVIEGLEGGREHDCEFVAGNWPRFANLDFTTDLHVAP